jgi:murein DD-endopeptidase MepM/ murein hydrolase activator NlpD
MLERIIPTHPIDTLDSPTSRKRQGDLRGIGGTAAVALLLAACNSSGITPPSSSEGSTGNDQGTSNLILPFEGTWYLTGGPHFDGLSKGIRYALDFAPKEVVNCPGGATLTNEIVIASESGKVTVVGNQNDATDPNHSVVEITNSQGLTVGSMHLDNIRVKVGQDVLAGDPLGNPSCETSPGGESTGIHLHEFLEKNGQPIAIAGTVFSGLKVNALTDNYQGTMFNANQFKTADTRRCDESTNCGLRNDLTGSPLTDVLGAEITPSPNPETPLPQVSGENLFQLLLTTPVLPSEMPPGMILRGNSVENLDVTLQTLGAIGEINISVDDEVSLPSGGFANGNMLYIIFPDTLSAKAGFNYIVGKSTNNHVFDYSDYSISIGSVPNIAGHQDLAATLTGNVVIAALLTGIDKNIVGTNTIELEKAAIDHLNKVGQ